MKNIVFITVINKETIRFSDVEIEYIYYYENNPKKFIKDFKNKIREYLNNENIIISPPIILNDTKKIEFNNYKDNEKIEYFIRYPENFTLEYFKQIITGNNEFEKIFKTQFFCHIKDSNIYFYDRIDAETEEYWKKIKEMLDTIKTSKTTLNSSEKIPVHLVLHIGDNNLLNITDTSFFYKNNFDEDNLKKTIENINLNDYSIKTVTAFHHSDSDVIYSGIIKNKKFWLDCNIDKTDFITNAIKRYYDTDSFRDSLFNINNEYYHITNGEEEHNIKHSKIIDETNITNNQSDDYIILYATEHCFKLFEFYIALANFQLQGCDIEKYKLFIEEKNIINNKHQYIDTPHALNPKFDKDNFSKSIKPIIIYSNKQLEKLQIGYDRRINYLNSSIWLQYVSNQEEFKIAKENIEKWKGLYKTINAIEIAEFKARQLKNSFLREIDEKKSHANNVAPFIFHSETKMRDKAIILKRTNLEEYENEWRFLIVDDHATKQDSEKDKSYENVNGYPNIIPKCKIINNLLSKHFNIECHRCKYDEDKTEAEKCWKECNTKNSSNSDKEISDKKITILFDCAVKMEDAIKKLKETKYDLILLDYLLDENKDGTRNYAYDLLKRIENKCESEEWTIKNNKIGPNGKFQMFYISAFTNAVRERMLEQSLDYDSDYWYISPGACPTTTPYLFLFYLLRRMNAQIKEFTKLSKKEDLGITTLLDLLLKIYGNNDEKPRNQAIMLFNPLLELRLNYYNFKYDVCDAEKKCRKKLPPQNVSALISSLFPDVEYYDNAFWEHTMHLVYLTAFGTIRQWHEMWEEFMLIKSYLQKAYDEKDEYDKISVNPKIKEVISNIETYIISLQKQSG